MGDKCEICGVGLVPNEQGKGVCFKCEQNAERGNVKEYLKAQQAQIDAILVTTEPDPGLNIKQRKGIISAECVFATNTLKDLMISVRDTLGGRSNTLQKEMRKAKSTVLTELKQEAVSLGANAVIGTSLKYSQMSGKGDQYLLIAAVGTAVLLEA